MPKHSMISIPLDIPDVHVLQTEWTNAGELILTVESTLDTTTCRCCGRLLTKAYALDEPRMLRHLPILGRVVYLRIRPKRFRCPFCDDHPTTTQQLDWYDPKALHTKAYERHVIVLLVNSTLTDVTAKEDVTADALRGILDRWIARRVDWDALDPFVTLGIDEIALLKGHRDFVALCRQYRIPSHPLLACPRLKSWLLGQLRSGKCPHQRMQDIAGRAAQVFLLHIEQCKVGRSFDGPVEREALHISGGT